ncbi:MAG TPA: hypothetical protein VGW10_09830, partial [Solirubrobacteraceae bacterium]|nr:hypothetical protein [Solirubrobacteraceae bacterium]
DLNARWARHFAFIEEIKTERDLASYEAMARQEEAMNVKTLIAVMSNQGQAPSDPQAEADKLGMIAAKVAGIDAIQVWNEADESLFWSGGPNPGAYVDFLKRSHAAIKAANPNVVVVFSPTVGNNFGFVDAAYKAGAKGYFDAMAVHTDTACLDQPPSSYYREPDGRVGRFAFLGYRSVRETMLAHGDDKPIWMTEFGWSAAQHTCEFGAGAGQKPAGVSEADQAKYLLAAMNCLERDPYVTVAMWFNNRDLSGDGKMENMYGLRRFDSGQRPAFEAFRTWTSGGGRSQEPCGDFEGPAVRVLAPQPGFALGQVQNLFIRAQSDAPDLRRIWFSVEGPGAGPLFADGPISLPRAGDAGPIGEREWGGARDLQNGAHRLTVSAEDLQGNIGPPVVVEFTKGVGGSGGGGPIGPGGGPAGLKARFPKVRLGGRGRVRTLSGAALPGITGGVLRVEWQNRRRGKWKRIHAKSTAARRPFRFRQRLRFAGLWRVRLVYLGKAPVKRTASCWLVFNTKSAKTKTKCPRGAVRPR